MYVSYMIKYGGEREFSVSPPFLEHAVGSNSPMDANSPQGMNLIKSASEHFKWGVDLGECARIWKGGCIIRAAFLDDIKRAYLRNPHLDNLLVDPDFSAQIMERQVAWRRVVTLCVASGIAAPAMTASLSYFDSYRRARLPANLVQVSDTMIIFKFAMFPPLSMQCKENHVRKSLMPFSCRRWVFPSSFTILS